MSTTSAGPLAGMNWRSRATAAMHLSISALSGLVAGFVAGFLYGLESAWLVGWLVGASVFIAWTATTLWPLDATDTARLAVREDPSRAWRDLVLLAISVGAMFAVGVVIFRAHQSGLVRLLLGIGCVIASWVVLHTIFALKYARLYYGEPVGGFDFKQDDAPTYRDFAYVAFTVGMTYQVADTDIQSTKLRTTVLRHAMLSFVFGTVIIAITINLVAGLGQ